MKASRIIKVVAAVAAVAVVGLLGWFAYRMANATAIYTVRLDCTTLPATDDALREWLAGQPGVRAASVHRDGTAAVVEYERSHWSGQPPLDPFGAAKRLGYGFRGFTGEYKSRW